LAAAFGFRAVNAKMEFSDPIKGDEKRHSGILRYPKKGEMLCRRGKMRHYGIFRSRIARAAFGRGP